MPLELQSPETTTGARAPGRTGERSNNFDFLRFALAALVIFSHSFDLLHGRESNPSLIATRGQTELGSVAVDGFFVLSGFLITMSFVNSGSVWDYMRRRALRIYPGYLVAALASLLFFAPFAMGFSRDYWHWVEPGTFLVRLPFLRTLAVPDTFHQNHWPYVNAPVWTIQHEFVCYILVAALGLLGALRKRAVVLALFVPVYLFQVLQFPLRLWIYNWQELPLGGAPDYYPRFWTYFLIGALAFLYRERIRLDIRVALGGAACLVAAGVSGHGLDAVMPFALAYILLSLAFAERLRLQHWARRGDFSYGLYLYGWPVQQSLIMLCKPWITTWLLFAMAVPCSLAFAVCSWYAVERPFLRLKSKRSKERGTYFLVSSS
jgi:peptidoglycan/LPS O-acetylase OafA/YrhL